MVAFFIYYPIIPTIEENKFTTELKNNYKGKVVLINYYQGYY
jgi:hypothetical protein